MAQYLLTGTFKNRGVKIIPNDVLFFRRHQRRDLFAEGGGRFYFPAERFGQCIFFNGIADNSVSFKHLKTFLQQGIAFIFQFSGFAFLLLFFCCSLFFSSRVIGHCPPKTAN